MQFEPAASELPQPLLSKNWLLFAPMMLTLLMFSGVGPEPVLVSLTFIVLLPWELTFSVGKLTLIGLKFANGLITFAKNVDVSGLPGELVATLTVAESVPTLP